ncbi:peptidylprolyl isomerase [Methylococcus sp. EFPC2]|uniref:FKBP-type peptidyl-prolyl cis-trans isomerase n=1 Tax=Methylococcus sp. EFPC2 TaxID=2812648 RepID=UPI001966E2C7|nr:peptidylprolyl isomerase [Methylococcus sp. EFPC2]QSA96371.1 peptidylprolyl isomerase [Methylococcus sp. EFPC2]
MVISADKVVLFHYTLTDEEGEVLDSSEGHGPLAYIHGQGNIIPGLENALAGKSVGDRLDVTVTPEEGYGLRDEDLIQAVPKNAFEGVDVIEPGMQFHAEGPEGLQLVTVLEVLDDEVILDGNHPMAGLVLNFAVEITDIRDATAEELDHGHVHGPDGHHHH